MHTILLVAAIAIVLFYVLAMLRPYLQHTRHVPYVGGAWVGRGACALLRSVCNV